MKPEVYLDRPNNTMTINGVYFDSKQVNALNSFLEAFEKDIKGKVCDKIRKEIINYNIKYSSVCDVLNCLEFSLLPEIEKGDKNGN